MVTIGAYEALHCIINAVINPGDEVSIGGAISNQKNIKMLSYFYFKFFEKFLLHNNVEINKNVKILKCKNNKAYY